ncbi:DUF5662 family protein [Micromonospora sp. KC207]|uniref:DUF5662 family protein n=1 Tax=Micromonospora sp. KC207 TaxID=2530377 RepID=UPI001A9F252D|nr:DUF5662 family protein [Micromonospora sp. KC207]
MTYDSRPDTLIHSLRVGTLMGAPIKELIARSTQHDLSKLEPPEVETYDEYVPKLQAAEYGSDEYRACLAAMGDGLAHHYAHNAHHPEHHDRGINGMTLVDLIEMLADWRAASERRGSDLADSMPKSFERFGIDAQLAKILTNTARHFGWIADEATRTDR